MLSSFSFTNPSGEVNRLSNKKERKKNEVIEYVNE